MSYPAYIYRIAKDGQWYFTLHASNAEVILTSETYSSKWAAQNGVASCQVNSQKPERYRIYGPGGLLGTTYHFTLTGANGEVIGQSESYTTARARDEGIESVRKNGSTSNTR